MTIQWSHVGAAAAILGLVAWLASGPGPAGEGGSGEPGGTVPVADTVPPSPTDAAAVPSRPTGGSEVPCSVPLGWHVDRVDGRFDLDPARAADAVREAAALWERAAGRSLFVNDSTGGIPIRLVYDDRQAVSRENRRLEAALEADRRRLEERRVQLDSSRRHHARLASRFRERMQDFERRVAAHNMAARSWSRSDAVPEAAASRLRAAGRALEEERRELAETRAELDSLAAGIRREWERVRRRTEAYDRRGRADGEAFPPTPVESGVYREAVRREDGRLVSVRREIVVYRFDDVADLRRVITHELGHALGLGHSGSPGALMSAEYGRVDAADGGPVIRAADLEMLRERCPELSNGAAP